MIFSFVVDPTVVSRSTVESDVLRQNLHALLMAITENGVLLDTPTEQLLTQLVRNALSISGQAKAKQITLLIEILRNNKRKLVASCPATRWPASPPTGDASVLAQVASTLKADAVICDERSEYYVGLALRGASQAVKLKEFLESEVQRSRHAMENISEPFDAWSDKEREERIARAVRYAPEIAIYDRMIGEVQGLKRFKEGISFIIEIWGRHRLVEATGRPKVRIVTRTGSGGKGVGPELIASGKRIKSAICEPIALTHNVDVTLEIKADPDAKFHARYLEAKARAFWFDRGFDLFWKNDDGSTTTSRNFVKRDPAGESHLSEVKAFPTAFA